jgi:hypothetical protein
MHARRLSAGVRPGRVQKIIDRAGLERCNGVLVEGRDNDDNRHHLPGQIPYDFKAAH